jgi:hypothetical protein
MHTYIRISVTQTQNLQHVNFGRMTKRWEEKGKRRILSHISRAGVKLDEIDSDVHVSTNTYIHIIVSYDMHACPTHTSSCMSSVRTYTQAIVQTHTNTHTHTHKQTTHTYTNMHARTHKPWHTHMHTHTNSSC